MTGDKKRFKYALPNGDGGDYRWGFLSHTKEKFKFEAEQRCRSLHHRPEGALDWTFKRQSGLLWRASHVVSTDLLLLPLASPSRKGFSLATQNFLNQSKAF
jgi:hypothetical protein